MNHTEEKARTKWCPMSRQNGYIENPGACNRPIDKDYHNCIASACMMWIQDYNEEKREGHSGGKEQIYHRAVETSRTAIQESYDLYKLPATGHCGLAR